MLKLPILIIIVVSAIEIIGLVLMGQLIGGGTTFLLVLLTGLLGVALTTKEAKKVWYYAQHQLSTGQIPGNSLLDGICIFVGGLLLLPPGFMTDIVGFLLVIPYTRVYFRAWLLWLIQRYIKVWRFRS